MTVFRIVMPGVNQRTGAPDFMHFECEKETVQDLAAALGRDEIVLGQSLFTRAGGPQTWNVIGRKAVGLTRHGVARIEVAAWRFVDAKAPEAA